jgi:DNA gyrase subunit A
MEVGTVRQIDINSEMQGAYLDYAMSVIIARALPDVRDGLKPVHRRILFAMYDMGLRSDKPYKKSARIVGEVLGKYHPHGDAAVYESMARMAQDFSLRYVLVDGQGNFGSIDGDSPAAMRYTEARIAAVAEEILADIDKETVDFVANFDDTLKEPAVLPASLPNLLVNGASGIAVGMTTNIPPHNLGEVCDALVYLIDRYDKLDDVTVEDLTKFILGPDFPTGGVVYRYAGEDDNGDRLDLIRNAYALGRGQLTVQAHVHIEEMSRNRSRIVVTELPYQVNKTRLIERVAELVRDGKIEGITDLRDESDRQGMRICIEMTRTVEPRDILSQLFKLTPMQTTFGLAMLALVDGEPRLLPLKRVLIHYLEHRQEIITRRSHYLLDRAKLRAHILEGLLRALDYIDEVIDTIRRSRTAETAQDNLMKRFRLSEIQAQAILDMPLKRLADLERRKIAEEYREKLEEIKYLESLLSSPAKIRGVIRADLLALKAKYGDTRRTRIVDRETGYHTAHDLVEAADVLVTLWNDGQVYRTAKAPRVSSRAVPVCQVWGNTRDDVAFFTASGQVARVPLHQIPEDQDTPVSNLSGLDRAETFVAALILPHAAEDEAAAETFLTLGTRGGRIKRIAQGDLSAALRGAVSVMNVEEGDQLAWVAESNGQSEILLVTRQGKAIRFAEEEVRPMGLPAAGVLAIKFGSDDAVVGMGIVQKDAFVITVTERGYAKRTAVKDFPVQKRYGGGVQAVKLTPRTGPVVLAALAGVGDEVVLTTAKGKVTKLPVKAIHAMGRATSGHMSPQGTKEAYLEPEKHGAPLLLTVLEGSKETAQPAQAQAEKPAKAAAPRRAAAARKAPARPARSPAAEAVDIAGETPASSRKATRRSRSVPGATGATQEEGTTMQMALTLEPTAARPARGKSRAQKAEPAAAEQVRPKRTRSESAQAKPTRTKPAKASPAAPEPATSGQGKSKTTQAKPAEATSPKASSTRSRPTKTEPAKASPAKSKATRSKPAEAGPAKAGPAKSSPTQSGAAKGEPVKTGPVKAKPTEPKPTTAEPARPKPAGPGAARPKPKKSGSKTTAKRKPVRSVPKS